MTKAIQIRVDEKLKKKVDIIFYDMGLDMPTAIRLFLKKVAVTKSIPFELKSSRTENGFTPEFEDEILKAATEKDQIGPFKSAKEAIAATLQKGGRGASLSTTLKDVLSKYLYQHTHRRPMVIPVVTEL